VRRRFVSYFFTSFVGAFFFCRITLLGLPPDVAQAASTKAPKSLVLRARKSSLFPRYLERTSLLNQSFFQKPGRPIVPFYQNPDSLLFPVRMTLPPRRLRMRMSSMAISRAWATTTRLLTLCANHSRADQMLLTTPISPLRRPLVIHPFGILTAKQSGREIQRVTPTSHLTERSTPSLHGAKRGSRIKRFIPVEFLRELAGFIGVGNAEHKLRYLKKRLRCMRKE
jgi:hypothetical protein